MSLEGESYENLGKLYKEGYHVCPMAYGQFRRGECLFLWGGPLWKRSKRWIQI